MEIEKRDVAMIETLMVDESLGNHEDVATDKWRDLNDQQYKNY